MNHESLPALGKILIGLSVVLFLAGLLLINLPRIPFIGKLPGDFLWKKGNTTIYFPLATSLILSVLVSLILFFIVRIKNH